MYAYLDRMPKRPSINEKDEDDLAAAILAEATGQPREKNPAAVALGKLGGHKGGKARMAGLSERQRKSLARKAARARWGERKV